MRRLAVAQGRWKEFIEAPLMLWAPWGRERRKRNLFWLVLLCYNERDGIPY
jgi:hypothetical protein